MPASININHKKMKNKLVKSIVPVTAIVFLAALVLVGCNQNTPSSSTDAQSTNSSTGGAGVNTPPNVNTNMPAGTN
jgi:hypothetical protein